MIIVDDGQNSHSSHNMNSVSDQTVGIHALMPLITKKGSSSTSQFHCMNIMKNMIKFNNQDKVPVDVSYQPVFAISKEVQLRYPLFSPGRYFCLFGDLHIEQSLIGLQRRNHQR